MTIEFFTIEIIKGSAPILQIIDTMRRGSEEPCIDLVEYKLQIKVYPIIIRPSKGLIGS